MAGVLVGTWPLTGRPVSFQLKRKQVHPQRLEQDQGQEQQTRRQRRGDTDVLRQHLRIFIFTFKLACLFLVCSLPYKLSVLLSGLGAPVSFTLITTLGMVRMLYHILDGWTFCANEELLDTMKAMVRGCCCCALARRTFSSAQQQPPDHVTIAVLPQPVADMEGDT